MLSGCTDANRLAIWPIEPHPSGKLEVRQQLQPLGNCMGRTIGSLPCQHSQAWQGQLGGILRNLDAELTSTVMIILIKRNC